MTEQPLAETASRVELRTCEYGVPDGSMEGIGDCGEPAVAKWCWPCLPDSFLFVCDKHDLLIAEQEEHNYVTTKEPK